MDLGYGFEPLTLFIVSQPFSMKLLVCLKDSTLLWNLNVVMDLIRDGIHALCGKSGQLHRFGSFLSFFVN